MVGKPRSVHFFSAVEIDEHDNVLPFGNNWWMDLLDFLEVQDAADRRLTYRGRKYVGRVEQSISPVAKYLYLGKLRPGADWPDVVDREGGTVPLASTGILELIEPLYLLPVEGTPYMAVLRTSAGPTWPALTDWLGMAGRFYARGHSIELQPYARRDQVERLRSAVGATKIHLKFDPGAAELLPGQSQLARAVREASAAGAGAVSVEMSVSFGRARPDEAGADELVEGLREIIGSDGYTRAEATLLQPSVDGVEKDYVDFALDRVVYTEYVGESEDETPTPEAVLHALSDAIDSFRTQLRSE
ncbi:hypothetical protein J2X60_000163 [Curtobacterium sp. 320]|uniref:hypothetical protein n=1 Tax=Curtobacterium sp. 320 TaxID=2817749 RepID=UPI00285D5365|nr:hypothetical protein [Curtobacterium sp. 320]MDR6571538.1 hypothetical protein [Curtobacterium sp. 320]